MPPSPYLENDLAYPPMGLLYLGAVIEKMGHYVKIIELGGNVDWRKKVETIDADLIGIQMVTPNFVICNEIINILKKHSKKPIILGGAHPSFLPEDCLGKTKCDAVVTGEGEVIIKKVINDLIDGGLNQRIYEGGVVPIEAIPKPARHLVDLQRYRPGGEKTTTIYTSRGCPYNCAFCSRVTGRTYREFPIDRVIEEVTEITHNYGFSHVLFGDDNIGVHEKRVQEVCLSIHNLNIGFRLNIDTRTLSEKTCRIAAKAGCTEISFGIESGSDRILQLMQKGTTAKENAKFVKRVQNEGILTKAYFVVNFPGENEESVKQTLKWAEDSRPDKWLLSAFVPLPGSLTFRHPEKYGITWLSNNWEDYYLVAKGGSFKPSFIASGLNFEQQKYLHNLLFDGLVSILGK